MRVLHLLDHSAPCRTDYSRRTLALLDGLRNQGVQTVHLTGPGQPAGGTPAEGWHFYRTRPAPGGLGKVAGAAAGFALTVLRLRQVARLTRPQLIHVHLPSWQAVAALPVARLSGLPLVVEAERRARATHHPFPRLERWALGGAQAIAAGAAQVRAALRAEGVGGKRIAVIPPAPDLQALARMPTGPAGLEGAPLLAYAGGLERGDGVELLLAALASLRRAHPALRLVVAGGGAAEARLEERLRHRAVRGHVVFSGVLSSRRAADVLARADIAVFPALASSAPLLPSRHLLNAMAQGCAIVASDVACHRELLVHGLNAILFQAGSSTALADAIGKLLAEPWRLGALGNAAREFVGTRRSWEATAARYRKLYETVLRDASR